MRSHSIPLKRRARHFLAFAIASSLALVANQAGAATIFEWGGSYVSAHTEFTATPTATPGQLYYQYSNTTPIGTAGGKLYGTFLLQEAGATPTFNTDVFGYRGTPTTATTIALGATAGPNALTMRGAYFFQREDFLVPGSAPITFDNNSVFSYTVSSSGGNNSTRRSSAMVYALVNGEWNWYVSINRFTGQAENSLKLLGDSKWALYDLSQNAILNLAPASGSDAYSILGSSFEDIGAIGIYFNYERLAQTSEAGRNLSFYVNYISLTAEAIPEPSVVLLGGVGLALLVLGWSRRRRPVGA